MTAPIQVGRYAAQLSVDDLLEFYWYMLLSRRLDERTWAMHRQGKIAFHVSAIGHEALQVAAAMAINRGVDFVYPYYRDLGMVLTIGMTPEEFMLSLYGKVGEVTSGARQMPSHWSSTSLRLVTQSSVVAVQVPQAAGTAFGIQYRQKVGLQDPNDASEPRLALCALGEGSTSQGEWHEGMNWAGVHQLPFICIVENNDYAISVPYDKQAKKSIAERAEAYGVRGITVDGTDPLAMYDAMREAVERAYSGEGATCIEAKCVRLVPHSSDDDDRTYRTADELQEIKQADPLPRFRAHLLEQGVLTEEIDAEYEAKIKQMINAAQKAAEEAPYPEPADHLDYEHTFAPAEEGKR